LWFLPYTRNLTTPAMKNTFHIPAILFFLICTTTLVMAQRSVYTLPFENKEKLPPMEVRLNTVEIAGTYQTTGDFYTSTITGMGEEPLEQTYTTMSSDIKAVDAVRFLQYYAKEQLLAPGDRQSGTVEMSIIYYQSRNRANLGTALNILTLGIGTFLGIPLLTGITDVEVEATFYNDLNQILAIHRGVGRSKMLETLYNQNSTKRIQHQKALRNALADLNARIMADPLLHPGPVSASFPLP
jgi:hypothetical protein